MTPGIRAPFFLLLLLASLKGFLALPSQKNNVTTSQDTSSSLTSTTTPVHSGHSDPATSPGGDSTGSPVHSSTLPTATSSGGESTSTAVHSSTSSSTTTVPVGSSGTPVHSSTLSPATSPPGNSTTSAAVQSGNSDPITSPPEDSTSSPVHSSPSSSATTVPVGSSGSPVHSSPSSSATTVPVGSSGTPVHSSPSSSATTVPVGSSGTPVHSSPLSPATSPIAGSSGTVSTQPTKAIPDLASTPTHNGILVPTTSSALGSATSPVHSDTSKSDVVTTRVYSSTSFSTTQATSGSALVPGHNSSSVLTTSSVLGSATSPVHNTSAMATTPAHSGTQSSVPSQRPVSPTVPAVTVASSSYYSTVLFPTFSSNSSPQLSVGVSFFLLSFYIRNHPFNSSLDDPSSSYYQELKRNISGLFLQIFSQDFLGISTIKFRSGSVVVESTVVFQEGTSSASDVRLQLIQHKKEADDFNLTISEVKVNEMQFLSSAQSWPGVPGWGIALLVLVCTLVTLAIVYLIALAVCQCRRKSYGQLDIFPTQDTYHPMSEYPTYHTHGRYVPPGSTKRSPFEEVSAGNGSSGLSYTNPAVASANL